MEQLTSGPAARVWRRWVLLSLASRLPEGASVGPADAPLNIEGRLARMRRTAGQRLVLWAVDPRRPLARETLLDAVPDWAVGDAEVSNLLDARVSFVAWHTRGQWAHLPAILSERARKAFAVVYDDAATTQELHRLLPRAPRQAAATAVAQPDLDSLTTLFGPALGRRAALAYNTLTGSGTMLSTAASQHLLDVLRAQMRQAIELGPREGGDRPRLLRQWAKVHLGLQPVRFAVFADDHGLHEGVGTRGLSAPQRQSLANVLRELRHDQAETNPSAGRWLFAQVTSEGRSIRVEFAYDHWPAWFVPSEGDRIPSFGALIREIEARAAQWRPAWAALLPN